VDTVKIDGTEPGYRQDTVNDTARFFGCKRTNKDNLGLMKGIKKPAMPCGARVSGSSWITLNTLVVPEVGTTTLSI
jgi:hypothetical protein